MRLVNPLEFCYSHSFPYMAIGSNFICEVEDVNVFSVGCISRGDECVVEGMSSGYYDANVSLQLERYLTDDKLTLPEGGDYDEAVLLWGDSNFGHWLFTYLNRLPLLFCKPELLEKPLMVLDTTPTPFLEWLSLMGFKKYFLAKDGSHVNRLSIPSVVHYRDERKAVHVSADAVHILRHLLAPVSRGSERIYISRDRATRRKAVNEDALVAYLSVHGVRRVFMEYLTAKEQIDLISRCELIVTVIGASSPITMLAPKTCKIIEIGLPGFSGIFGSAAWAMVIGQDYRRIEAKPVGTGINSDIEVPLCVLG